MDDLTKERYPEGPTWREGRGPTYKGLSIAMDNWDVILERRLILNEAMRRTDRTNESPPDAMVSP